MEEAAAVAIGVEVSDGVLFQFVGVKLGPLGRSEQGRLFAVPEAIDDGAGGLPALLEQFAEGACFFEFRAGAADGISGAVDPGVMMIAANDPLIGELFAGDGCDDIVERLAIPVEGDGEMGHALCWGRSCR